jgi:hypothetical protein
MGSQNVALRGLGVFGLLFSAWAKDVDIKTHPSLPGRVGRRAVQDARGPQGDRVVREE